MEGYLPFAVRGRGGSTLSWLYTGCSGGISAPLSGVAGKGRLAEEAVLLGVCGTSVPEPPLRLPRLERSNAARVGVTPSSCSRMPGMSPVLVRTSVLVELSGFEPKEAAYTLDSEIEPALARIPAEATEEVE